MSEPLAFLNGQFIAAARACLPVYDAGVVLGAAITEISRTFHHRPFRLDDHLDRLFQSAEFAGLDVAMSALELAKKSNELVAHNSEFLSADDDLLMSHFVTAGEVGTYARLIGRSPCTTPTIAILAFPLPFEHYAKRFATGAHLITPSIRQIPATILDPRMKCRSRMHYFMADREARQSDPEAVALLLDMDGCVTETSTSNFLIVERGTIVSPPAETILPGISLRVVRELADQLHISMVFRPLRPEDVYRADEAFLTSTPYCIMPVTRVNDVVIGTGEPGPIYRELLKAWSHDVGVDIAAQIMGRQTSG